MHFDHMQARGGKYTRLPDTLTDEMHSNGVEVRRLASRVFDAEVRAAVDVLEDRSARLFTSPRHFQGFVGDDLENRATSDMMELQEGFEALMAVLGEAVRREIAWRTAVEIVSAAVPIRSPALPDLSLGSLRVVRSLSTRSCSQGLVG